MLLPIFLIPVEEWREPGLILQDPMLDPFTDNPRGLPVRMVPYEDAGSLDPFELVAQAFSGRLGIPESEHLGMMVFRDAEGTKLVLFSA